MAIASAQDNRLLRWVLYIGVAIALLVSYAAAFGHTQIALSNDHKILVSCAKRTLEGMVPYVEWTDVSPPMIIILYMVPVLLSSWFGMPIMVAFNLYALFWVALSLWLMHAILAANKAPRYQVMLILSASALAMLGISFIHQVFADREHMVVVMTLPFMLLYSPLVRRAEVPFSWRVAVSVLAGIGFAIKPFFYLFYFAVLVYQLFERQKVRQLLRQREHWIVVEVGLLYTIVMFTYFKEWPLSMVPIGLKTYYSIGWALHFKVKFVLDSIADQLLAFPLIIAAVMWYNNRNYYHRLLNYLLLLMMAAVGNYFLNGGWVYTIYPFMAFSFLFILTLGCQLLRAAAGLKAPMVKSAVSGLIITAMLGMVYTAYALPAFERGMEDITSTQRRGMAASTNPLTPRVEQKFQAYLKQHPHFIFISTNYWPVNFEVEGSPIRHVSRVDYMWYLPGIVKLRHVPDGWNNAEELMSYLAEGMAEDIEKHSPGVIIYDVSKRRRGLPEDYNAIADLKTNKRFAATFSDYYLAEHINECGWQKSECAFDIYLRQ